MGTEVGRPPTPWLYIRGIGRIIVGVWRTAEFLIQSLPGSSTAKAVWCNTASGRSLLLRAIMPGSLGRTLEDIERQSLLRHLGLAGDRARCKNQSQPEQSLGKVQVWFGGTISWNQGACAAGPGG